MKIVYASRTGNVQKLIDRLGVDAVKITNGTEKVDGDYVLITYTDEVGIIPKAVEKLIDANKDGDETVENSVKACYNRQKRQGNSYLYRQITGKC